MAGEFLGAHFNGLRRYLLLFDGSVQVKVERVPEMSGSRPETIFC
jgi:hypothetical protein